ncbi:MAG: hypothetical protein U0528_14050 [Anaerolineae bacterium]
MAHDCGQDRGGAGVNNDAICADIAAISQRGSRSWWYTALAMP